MWPFFERPNGAGNNDYAFVANRLFGSVQSTASPSRDGGQWDGLVWTAAQTGSWYEQAHRAASIALEAGHQWTRSGGSPYAIAPHWSVNGCLAVARAGGVVKPAFAGHTLTFAYLENVLQF